MIKASQQRLVKAGYKFGIRVPKSVEKALELDQLNGNTYWYDAIYKEMSNVRVAFEFKGKGEAPPPGYQYVPLRMIFNIKMDFTCMARLVAGGGHLTDAPSSITYSSVVSCNSVQILLTIAALNDLDI